jgi:cardiolipin synthase
MKSPAEWLSEELFFDGESYFRSLLKGIAHARDSVRMESYIFVMDEVGKAVLDELQSAAARGVHVRLLVDGFGSLGAIDQLRARLKGKNVRLHVYHPLGMPALSGISAWMGRMNRRNHRKTCVVDGQVAWVGSFNVSQVHSSGTQGRPPWRDTGARVEGPEVSYLAEAFEQAWNPNRGAGTRARLPAELVRLNYGRRARITGFEDFTARIALARKRVWLTTPYFVPSHRLVRALEKAAFSGVDTRILVPGNADVPGMTSVAALFFEKLMAAGVAVHLYRPSILHAKTAIIDDWATVGSSNLNHRSLLHDLEADLVFLKPASVRALSQSFTNDLAHSRRLVRADLAARSWFDRSLGELGFKFRRWL